MERGSKQKKNRFSPLMRWGKVTRAISNRAAGYYGSGIVFLAAMILLAFWLFWYRPANLWAVHRTEAAQTLRVRLPDGSAVRLNGASSVRYEKEFASDRRTVYVTGQAWFEIVPDPRPFVALSGKAEIIALSSGLDVWQSKNKVRVYVPEGRALFFSGRGDIGATVKSGQMAMCLEGGFVSKPRLVDRHMALGWMEGRLHYLKTPLDEVLTDLERGYGAHIRLEEPELAWRTVNARFKSEDLAIIIAELCETLDLNFRFGNGYWLLSAKDPAVRQDSSDLQWLQ